MTESAAIVCLWALWFATGLRFSRSARSPTRRWGPWRHHPILNGRLVSRGMQSHSSLLPGLVTKEEFAAMGLRRFGRWFDDPGLSARRVALIYLGISVAWILLSDRLLALVVTSPPVLTGLQTVKGWFFVMVTATLLYVLVADTVRDFRAITMDAAMFAKGWDESVSVQATAGGRYRVEIAQRDAPSC